MTKKDYIIIAKAFVDAIKDLGRIKHSELAPYQIAIMVDNLCWAMAKDNKRFDSNKFKALIDKGLE